MSAFPLRSRSRCSEASTSSSVGSSESGGTSSSLLSSVYIPVHRRLSSSHSDVSPAQRTMYTRDELMGMAKSPSAHLSTDVVAKLRVAVPEIIRTRKAKKAERARLYREREAERTAAVGSSSPVSSTATTPAVSPIALTPSKPIPIPQAQGRRDAALQRPRLSTSSSIDSPRRGRAPETTWRRSAAPAIQMI